MDKEQTAIQRLRTASAMSLKVYREPLLVTTSGGKDSSVCIALAERAGIPFEVIHNHTTADAPETVCFVRDGFRRLELKGIKCDLDYPYYKGKRTSMWQLIPIRRIPPTRLARYCCSILKERGGAGRFITTGVRWEESESRNESRGIYEAGRKVILNNDNDDRRRLFEACRLQAKRVCNPIIDWTDHDIWDYIASEHLEVNPLYRCGFSRIGCVGCPMAGKGRQKAFARYPIYQKNYIRSFDRMLQARKQDGLPSSWESGEEVFHWWMEDGVLPGQIEMDDILNEMEADGWNT